MSQDTERLIADLTALADPRYGLARGFDDAQAILNAAIREAQASRKLVAAARTLSEVAEAEMIRLTGMAYPDGDFQCPADPCPYCTAQDEFAIALMEHGA